MSIYNYMRRYTDSEKNRRFGKIIAIIAIIVTVLAIGYIALSVKHVSVNNAAVEVKASQITGNVYDSGWYFKSPLVKFISLPLTMQEMDYGEVEAELKGGEIVKLTLHMKYYFERDKLVSIFQKGGQNYLGNLMPSQEVFDIVKSITPLYAVDAFPSSRTEIMEKVTAKLNERFSGYGIHIEAMSLANYNFDEALEKAISDVAAKRREAQAIEIDNENQLAVAKNEAAIKEEKANAEAKEITIKAAAQAEANRQLAESLTPNLIIYYAIEKWDSKLPTILGSGATSILDMSKVLNEN